MKNFYSSFIWIILIFSLIQCPAKTEAQTLLVQSFENSGMLPAGWVTQELSPGNDITVDQYSAFPSGYSAYYGVYMIGFNSTNASGGVIRLKDTIPISTVGYFSVNVSFFWLQSNAFQASNDRVNVQWSTDGTSWNTEASVVRFDTVPGWKLKSLKLPSGANNQPKLYIAFLFTSEGGYNCYLDYVKINGPLAIITDKFQPLSIFPSPASSILHIKCSGSVSGLEIFNSTGKTVINQPFSFTGSYDLDISPLSIGIYSLKIITPNGYEIKKFIVSR